jgi:WD40 repeat protein
MNTEQNKYISSLKIKNLHKNEESINSIQSKTIDNETNLLFTCCDDEINIYNTSNKTKTLLFSANEQTNTEINQLKLSNDLLYAANLEYLQIFDINTLKQLQNYKISRETINSIEFNQTETLIACSDDLGEIKLLDLRVKNLLANKKVLKKHANICSSVKFNPLNDNELFSGSFDSTIAKWDIRGSSRLNKISVSDVLMEKQQQQNDENSFLSTMTPCFVHSLCFTSLNQQPVLLAGIENGLCLSFNASTCECLTLKQVKYLNCGLTSIVSINGSNLNKKFQNYLKIVDSNDMFVSCGNDQFIEFFYLNNKLNDSSLATIEKLNKFKINHGYKINYTLVQDNKLYVCDTTDELTVYNIDVLCNDHENLCENFSNVCVTSK